MGSAGVAAGGPGHMLARDSQKVDGRQIAAFVRYRKNAKRWVAFRIGASVNRGLGGRIDALVGRDEKVRHACEPATGDRGGGKHVAGAFAGARASITIKPGVASVNTLPVSTHVC